MARLHDSKPQMHGQEQGVEQTHLPSEAENRENKLDMEYNYLPFKSSSSDVLSHKISPIVPPTEDQVSISLGLRGGGISYLNHHAALTHTTAKEA